MRTPAQIKGHPIHPMLVTLPIGLWLFSLACDLIALRAGTPQTWSTTSLYAMVGGILGALAAAVPGVIDMLSIRHLPIGKTAITHMSLNLVVVVLYIVNAALRFADAASPGATLALSVIAILVLAVSGWLGGKMVYEAGVGVHADEPAAARSGAWSRERGSHGVSGAGLRGSHAMASDADRPAREREERASGRPASDLPRE
jgi:uncharacterized membrane protein